MEDAKLNDLIRDLALIRASEAEESRKLEAEGTCEKIIVPCRDCEVVAYYYKSGNATNAPVIFDIHGGGFVMGHAALDDMLCKAFRQNLQVDVVSINYRLAPEFPYPAALNDVYDVVLYFAQEADRFGIDRNNMSLCGYSAGGNLAAAVSILAKETGAFNIKTQILVYPFLDAHMDPFKKLQIEEGIPPEMMASFTNFYLQERANESRSPFISPVYADQKTLDGLPPAIILTAGRDSLYSEGEEYAAKLARAGVPVFCMRIQNALHGFIEIGSSDYGIKKMPVDFQTKYANSIKESYRQGISVIYMAYAFIQTL